MFKSGQPANPKYENMTELMVDQDGTAIRFVAINRSHEWVYEYRDPSIDFRLEFYSWKETASSRDSNDVVIVGLTPWSLVPAILSHPELDIDQFEAGVRAKISEALLHWPEDNYINKNRPSAIRFAPAPDGKSLKECVAIAKSERQRNG
ncbi:MAG: hypothetical protein JSR47_19905 [Proteobacteria bacterium]|nr:hypothetical protein [Pseudomonadota bacterium]